MDGIILIPEKGIIREMINVVFPGRCPVCGEVLVRGRKICPECRNKLQFIHEPRCCVCGRQLQREDEELCGNCQRHRFSFDWGISLLEYNDAAARSAAMFKYGGRPEYLEYYGEEVLKRCGRELSEMNADAIIPVPLHKDRFRKRGYNQAEVLSRVIASGLGIPVLNDVLVRQRKTKALKELNSSQRLKNLSDAFAVKQVPAGIESVLLVDDIFTSGATIEACTRKLRAAGISHVYSFCLMIRADE